VGKPDKQPPSGWRWIALSDVARLETGHTPSRKHPEYWGGDVPWIGIKDATENHGRIISDTSQHTNELGIANSSARVLPANTVCLSRTASVGYVVVMGKPMATSQDFVNWVCSEGIDYRFLKYVLLAEQAAFLRFASGTTHQTIYFPEVKAFHVCLPPIPEQCAIAHILGTLDDKIELNRRMSETLEAMARALFKSWFVDFDPVRAKAAGRDPGLPQPVADLFPARLVDSELGDIPEGWETTDVGSLCSRIAMGPFGSDIKTDNFVESGVPVVRGSNLKDGFVEDDFVFLTEEKADELRNANAFPGDIVITHRGTLGQVGLIPERSRFPRYVVSQSQMLLTVAPERILPRYLYMYLRAPGGQHALLANTSQTGVPAIARPTASVKAIPLIVPRKHVLDVFGAVVEVLYRRLDRAVRESHTLAALRDTLLTKLISGELRVNDAHRFFEAASP
jgi:type I restriction enzyme S subunit